MRDEKYMTDALDLAIKRIEQLEEFMKAITLQARAWRKLDKGTLGHKWGMMHKALTKEEV